MSGPVSDNPAAWQPIETAPKDRTSVLIFSPDASDKGIMVGVFVQYSDEEYWVDAVDGEMIDAWPTHWMPLPEPPDALLLARKAGGS